MEDARFDGLVRALGRGTSRRGVFGLPASLAILGAGLGILAPEEADGRKRRKQDKQGKDTHHDRQNGHVTDEKKKKKKKKKKPQSPVCTPDAKTTTCAGKCGRVTNNCDLAVDCGSCACVPACAECFTCTGSPGTCVPAEGGTPCGAATCDNGTLQPRGTCDGAGICEAGSPEPCAPYTQCAGNTCATTCADDDGCVAGSFCNQDGHCAGDGADGTSCSHDGQCQSGVCAQGVCCNKACDDSCAACDLSGTVGICTTRGDGDSCATSGGKVCCSGSCQECCASTDCPVTAPFCTDGTCDPCRTNPGACPGGTCCDWEGGACVANCPESAPMCDSQGDNFCVPRCESRTDCANSGAQQYICVDHMCRACDAVPDITGQSAANAIVSAQAGQTVYICPGTYSGLAWSPGDFLFGGPITVIGAGDGAGGTALSGRVRTPPSGTTLRGLQISGAAQGVSLEGGGVTLIDCTVRDNQIGVLNVGGTVEMQRCNVVSNTFGGINNVGGAITLRNSTVEQNTATQGAGISSESAPGAGLYASLNLHDSKVRFNTATTSGGGIASGGNNAQVNFYGTTVVCGNSPANSQCTGFSNSACTANCS